VGRHARSLARHGSAVAGVRAGAPLTSYGRSRRRIVRDDVGPRAPGCEALRGLPVPAPGGDTLYRLRPVLQVAGRPAFPTGGFGARVPPRGGGGAGNDAYQAYLDVFLTTLSSLLHATALITAGGAPAAEFLPDALSFITGIPEMIGDGAELVRRLEAGDHPGSLSTAQMMGATADHILRTSESLGVDRELPKAVKTHYDQIIAAGRGSEDWSALYDVIKARS
jgi:hypothetical protein